MMRRPMHRLMRRFRARAMQLVGLLALAGSACAPTVVWTEHSPDLRRTVQAVQETGAVRIDVDGRTEARYRAVPRHSVRFSRTGRRLAYAAQRGRGWSVVLDGRPGEVWDGVDSLLFSDDEHSFAFMAERQGAWHVVRDGHTSPPWPSLRARTLRFSPDGRDLFFVAEERGQVRVVQSNRAGPAFDGVSGLTFSPDGAHVGYVGRRARAVQAVIDGQLGDVYEAIVELVLRRQRVGMLARRGGRWHAVIDGQMGPAYDLAAAMTLSPDGSHTAYIGRREQSWVVVHDGLPGFPFAHVDALQLQSDGRPLYVAREGTQTRVVSGDRVGPAFRSIDAPVLAAAGSRFGYVARDKSGSRVVLDGDVHGAAVWQWAGDLTLSDDGRHVAHLARQQNQDGVWHDGRFHRLRHMRPGSLVLSNDGQHVACLEEDQEQRTLYINVDGQRTRALSVREILVSMMRDMPSPTWEPAAVDTWLRSFLHAELARLSATRTRIVP